MNIKSREVTHVDNMVLAPPRFNDGCAVLNPPPKPTRTLYTLFLKSKHSVNDLFYQIILSNNNIC